VRRRLSSLLAEAAAAGAAVLTPDAAASARAAVAAAWHPEGAARGRDGRPDAYFTVFALLCARALDAPWDRAALSRWLSRPAAPAGAAAAAHVDRVARDWLAVQAGEAGTVRRAGILARAIGALVAGRADPYAAFWGLVGIEAAGLPPPWGLLATVPVSPAAATSRLAAALAVRALAGRGGDGPGKALRAAIEARRDASSGGYAAGRAAAPDLLSTATAVLALAWSGRAARPEEADETCGYVVDCRAADGLWADRPGAAAGDVEYAFYALAALGTLAAAAAQVVLTMAAVREAADPPVAEDHRSNAGGTAAPPSAARGRLRIDEARRAVALRLLAQADAAGSWPGELTASALSTALAVSALERGDRPGDAAAAAAGAAWLAASALPGGGWGDTPDSPANLTATLIAWAALAPRADSASAAARRAAEAWIAAKTGAAVRPETIAAAVKRAYGDDRTFAAPILFYLAFRGAAGADRDAWRAVPPLPFALALLPRWLFPLLRLQVVSYALPALIAVGLARHVRLAAARGRRAPGRMLAGPLLNRLERLQPPGGGFLEAVPLTAFTVLALDAAGFPNHPVARRGRDFLRAARRPDGSWPIDTNLRGWLTTLAVQACAAAPGGLDPAVRDWRTTRSWILANQTSGRHPFTGARRGGWPWTDAPGGVPDADDTAAALLALRALPDAVAADARAAAARGCAWLADLQNADGGVPTFCRGWGRLPFDRSCADITAHALRAWLAWSDLLPAALRLRLEACTRRALACLAAMQQPDGAWLPLWFGSQQRGDGCNPTVGTARVLPALRAAAAAHAEARPALARGAAWLLANQDASGGWGPSAGFACTVEETALAVTALARGTGTERAAAVRGAARLAGRVASGDPAPSPIGLYFARLWYGERLYPLLWTVEALNGVAERCGGT
jgi:squalene-hopene/tetraprenyl-beta-curcumene cyclase